MRWLVLINSVIRRFLANKIPVGAAPPCLPSTNQGNHGGIAPTIIDKFFRGNYLNSWCQGLRHRSLLLGLTFCLLLNGFPKLPGITKDDDRAFAQSTDPILKQAPNQAESLYQAGQYREAIAAWLQLLEVSPNSDTKAKIHSNLGVAYRQIGQISEAIAHWQAAITIYKASSSPLDRARIVPLQIDRAQAYSTIGQHRQAIPLLQSAIDLALTVPESQQMVIAAKGALGNAYLGAGDYERSLVAYQESISLADQQSGQESQQKTQQKTQWLATGWMNVGNVLTKRAERYYLQIQVAKAEGDLADVLRLQQLRNQDLSDARIAYDRSLTQNADAILQAKILLNLAHLPQITKNPQNAQVVSTYLQKAATLLASTPPSRAKAYALIDLATLNRQDPTAIQIQTIEQAIATSKTISDQRAESFALGTLGHIYEVSGELDRAMTLTTQAQWIAQQINAGDSLYRWQWQAGRLHQARGDRASALAAYREAISTLQSIRSDIVAADRSLQFDVRDSVEPVYREMIGLLLAESETISQKPAIEEALKVSELLRLSELQNFFGDECVEITPVRQTSQLFPQQKVAFIHSLTLDRRTYMVLRLPDGTLKTYLVPLSQEQLRVKISYLRFTLENIATDEYLVPAQEVYDLLIRPMTTDLAKSPIDMLVFVNDGILRSVPMAALYDGKQFLIQKYPITSVLGTSLSPRLAENAPSIQALAFGLSEAIPPFSALPNVPKEIQEVKDIVGGQKYLNRDFTFKSLQEKVEEGFAVVHLATHAKFGATPESTFLQAFDRTVSLDQLETILRKSKNAIELLVLSACQTAVGDNRSTLGLAGVALRSGVKSVLATLWSVNDADIVPLIQDFYQEWQKPGVTKAEALRRAQIKNINSYSGHPAIWAAFILVGN
jgi:CHAT domain-containing protein